MIYQQVQLETFVANIPQYSNVNLPCDIDFLYCIDFFDSYDLNLSKIGRWLTFPCKGFSQ